MKVKINILLASPLPILVLSVPVTPKRILVKVLMLLGIKVPIILLTMILKWRRGLWLLLLIFKLIFFFFFLLIK
jgi:hypothetical protein